MSQETFQPDSVRVGGATYTADDVGEVLDQLAARNAELTAIEARVAVDKRVLDAAEALREAESASPYLGAPPELVELIAAVDARRALTGAGPEVVITRPVKPCTYCAVVGGHTAICAVSTGRYE